MWRIGRCTLRCGRCCNTAGRWPLEPSTDGLKPWPPELLEEFGRRCGELDLQQILDDTRPHLAAAALVQRDARRVTSARNWIARVLLYF